MHGRVLKHLRSYTNVGTISKLINGLPSPWLKLEVKDEKLDNMTFKVPYFCTGQCDPEFGQLSGRFRCG